MIDDYQRAARRGGGGNFCPSCQGSRPRPEPAILLIGSDGDEAYLSRILEKALEPFHVAPRLTYLVTSGAMLIGPFFRHHPRITHIRSDFTSSLKSCSLPELSWVEASRIAQLKCLSGRPVTAVQLLAEAVNLSNVAELVSHINASSSPIIRFGYPISYNSLSALPTVVQALPHLAYLRLQDEMISRMPIEHRAHGDFVAILTVLTSLENLQVIEWSSSYDPQTFVETFISDVIYRSATPLRKMGSVDMGVKLPCIHVSIQSLNGCVELDAGMGQSFVICMFHVLW